eukprot:scaffold95837_cov27-Prasinocladus_malaysianus.AAC.1
MHLTSALCCSWQQSRNRGASLTITAAYDAVSHSLHFDRQHALLILSAKSVDAKCNNDGLYDGMDLQNHYNATLGLGSHLDLVKYCRAD